MFGGILSFLGFWEIGAVMGLMWSLIGMRLMCILIFKEVVAVGFLMLESMHFVVLAVDDVSGFNLLPTERMGDRIWPSLEKPVLAA